MQIARTVLLVRHMAKERADRVSRCLKARGVGTRTVRPFKGESLPCDFGPIDGVVVYGGVQSVNDAHRLEYLKDEIRWIEKWLTTGKPFLGICLGGQLLASALGARVARHHGGLHEIGYRPVCAAEGGNGFLDGDMHFYQWHNEGFELPDDTLELARGDDFPCQAYRYGERAYGLQFHPEVDAPMMTQWMDESGPESLCVPGGDRREKQLADAERFDPAVNHWVADFLGCWLGETAPDRASLASIG